MIALDKELFLVPQEGVKGTISGPNYLCDSHFNDKVMSQNCVSDRAAEKRSDV